MDTRSIREVIYLFLWEGTRRLSLRHIMCEKIPFWLRFFHPNTLITAQFIQNCEERRQTHLGKTSVQIHTNYARRKNLYMCERSDWKPGERDNLRDFLRFRDGPYSSSIIVAQSPKRPHGIWFLHRKNLAMQALPETDTAAAIAAKWLHRRNRRSANTPGKPE